MTKDRDFYRTFFSLAAVLMLQNIIVISVNLMDNIMLGGYSEVSLAAAAAVNQVQFVFQQLLTAMGEGVVIIGSQYWGQNKPKPIKNLMVTALRTAMILAAVLFLMVTFLPHPLLSFFTSNADIQAEGISYLNIIRFTYPFFAVTMIMQAVLRSVEMVKISLYLSIMTLFVNTGINFVLIYGRFGLPRLGIAGAAIGTLTARILECLVILIYASSKKHKISFAPSDYLKEDSALRGDYFHNAIPMMFAQFMWGMNNAVQTAVLGHLSDSAIAANSISATLYLLLKSMSVGAASATGVIVGKTIGEGQIEKVKEYARTMQVLFLMIGGLAALGLFFIRIPILGLYNLSGETRQLANTFLLLQCIVLLGMSYQMPVNNGIIRGGGSPQFVVKLDLISIWLIVIPLSLVMAFVVNASPVVVFICLNSDQVFKCLPAYLKVNKGQWIRKLTRV